MFVPTLQELLESLGRTLDTSVIPALDDTFARNQAIEISAQLRRLAIQWNDIGYWAAIECSEMRGALEGCLSFTEQAPASPQPDAIAALQQVIRGALSQTYPPDQSTRSPVSFGTEAAVLSAAMEQAIQVLHRLQKEQPEDRHLNNAREALRKVIRDQADRRDPKLDNAVVVHNN